MAVISKRVDDPRDRIEKATRRELYLFAVANGVTEIQPHMPAMLMRPILRRRGLTNINLPPRELGNPRGAAVTNNSAVTADVADVTADLAKQWQQEQAREEQSAAADSMSFNELKSALKARGVKLSRKDTFEDLKDKWQKLS